VEIQGIGGPPQRRCQRGDGDGVHLFEHVDDLLSCGGSQRCELFATADKMWRCVLHFHIVSTTLNILTHFQ
jgi:hypothetical protein